jgi:hypothetical protein
MDDFNTRTSQDFLGQDFLNASPPDLPDGMEAPVPGPKKRKGLPDKDDLFRVQKHLYAAMAELTALQDSDKLKGGERLEGHLRQAIKTYVRYLKTHMEQKRGF